MEFINKVLEHHARALEKEGVKMQEGEQSVYILNDGVVVISLERGTLGVNFIIGEPDRLDISTGMLEEGEEI